MSHNNPPIRNAVIAVLKEYGPMTRNDIAGILGWEPGRVHNTITNARRLHPEKMFRVVRYQRVEGKSKDQSVYAYAKGPDMPRPKVDKATRGRETRARYRRRHNATINARMRIRRAKQAGHTMAPNMFAQLAPREVRPYMTTMQRKDGP